MLAELPTFMATHRLNMSLLMGYLTSFYSICWRFSVVYEVTTAAVADKVNTQLFVSQICHPFMK